MSCCVTLFVTLKPFRRCLEESFDTSRPRRASGQVSLGMVQFLREGGLLRCYSFYRKTSHLTSHSFSVLLGADLIQHQSISLKCLETGKTLEYCPRDFGVFPISGHFPYSRDFVILPVSRIDVSRQGL